MQIEVVSVKILLTVFTNIIIIISSQVAVSSVNLCKIVILNRSTNTQMHVIQDSRLFGRSVPGSESHFNNVLCGNDKRIYLHVFNNNGHSAVYSNQKKLQNATTFYFPSDFQLIADDCQNLGWFHCSGQKCGCGWQ